MSNKPSIPKGTRDFSPIEMVRRNYIFDTIKKVYKKYGFQQIETPAMENLSTLIGTGGDESDKLIFKILNSGDYLSDISEEELKKFATKINVPISDDKFIATTASINEITKRISEKALHYDLTVPFARYVVQNQNDITFPFRRFQIQPVWRADRPQKGRYREFYQCDADIIGSDSLLNEVDLIKIIDDVFTELFQGKLNYTISVNNRKILQGIVESIGEQDKFDEIVVLLDKFDKIGVEGVATELMKLDFDYSKKDDLLGLIMVETLRDQIMKSHKLTSTNIYVESQILNAISDYLGKSINGQKGIEELEFIFEKLQQLELKTANVKFDPTLARGLGYYTGTIIEVKVDNFPSICGGGRYDDLTGKFGLKDVSGVGISFGADRIYDVLLDNDLYPEFKGDSTQVLFTNQGAEDEERFLPMLFQLREAGINSEIYPESAKWKKQMTFVERKNIPFFVSSNQDGELFVKNVNEAEKQPFNSIEDLINLIQ